VPVVAFTKMEGAGHDFVVLDCTRAPVALAAAELRRLADRHFGVGCDQVLVVEKPREPVNDFRYRIFNADGGEVEQCGNGARCFVKYVHAKGLTKKKKIRVETLGGLIVPQLEADGEVNVDRGPPVRESPLVQPLEVDGARVELAILSMGNPHAVQLVADVATAPVTTQGPLIEHHPRFPDRVNAGYMQVLGRNAIALRVWVPRAGQTLACGTRACAASVSGLLPGPLGSPVRRVTAGGAGFVFSSIARSIVWMKGPARAVFEGTIDLQGPP